MTFLLLAIACSTAIAVVFKLTGARFDQVALLTVNYLVATLVAALRMLAEGAPSAGVDPGSAALAVFLGVLFIASFRLFSYAISVAGISLATATMRLSVALPFLASWWVWGEVPTLAQGLGLVVAGVALVLISRPGGPVLSPRGTAAAVAASARPLPPLAVALVLAGLFLIGGTVDTSLKLFEEEFAARIARPQFLVMVFGTALLVGSALVALNRLRSGRWPARGVLAWGLGLGIINYLSVEFILLALADLPGTIVFPLNNVAIVALATSLGVVVWRERPGRANVAGLMLAAIALVLLAF